MALALRRRSGACRACRLSPEFNECARSTSLTCVARWRIGGANTPAEPIASNTLRLPWAELRELWPTLETRVFTTEAIGYLMGAFELNNLRLTVADPLGAHIDALDAVEEGETAAREASAHEQPVEAAMRVLARERAPERRPALGSALYALHSQVNHSCEPNVEAVPERRRGEPTGAAVLYALRDIEVRPRVCAHALAQAECYLR